MAIATVERKRVEEILDRLAELGGKAFREEEDIIFEGSKMVLPVGMNMRDGITFLKRKIAEDEEVAAFTRKYKYRPWDGAYCAYHAMKNAFGSVSHGGTTGFFASPPQLIDIEVGPGEHTQIPWGTFGLPFMPEVQFSFGATQDEDLGTVFVMFAEGPKKHRFEIEGIFALVENELRTNSIYRGKAIDGREQPGFIDLRGFDPEQIVYSGNVERQLDGNVLAYLRYAEEMRKNKIPLKRAVLMYGPYGTGKSEFGRITALTATQNGWTFVLARTGQDDLDTVMQTARLYAPAVVFFEDIDVIADPESRDRDGISKLLDTFDGITAKDTEILAVLTTNHPDRLHKGILRPGRLDAVIEIAHLDRDGVAQLVRNRIAGTDAELASAPVTEDGSEYEELIDWDAVFASMEGFTPAFVKAAADRSFTYALADNKGVAKGIVLTTEHLVAAGESFRAQLNLMNGAKEHPHFDPLQDQLERTVATAVSDVLPEILADQIMDNGRVLDEEGLALKIKRGEAKSKAKKLA